MKKNFKKILIVGVIFFFAGNLFAGPTEKGIEFNEARMYEAAKASLLEGIHASATAEAYYYLGDTYIMLDKEDSASYCFKKSLEMNPEYALPMVGEGKLLLKKKDTAAATEIFTQATKKDKKNPAVYTAIAAAYVEYGLFDSAPAMYEKARDVKKNYPPSFIVEGDLLVKKEKAGEACSKYENAYYFDSKYKVAYLQEARVYKHINTTRALEILDNLSAIDADYVPALVEYADIYYTIGYFNKAIPVYEKIMNVPGVNSKDIEKYATVLYFTKDYLNSLTQAKSVLAKDPNNFIMKRIEMYDNFELNNETEALALAEKFFASKNEGKEYIGQDYITYAKLLTKSKQDAAAITYYKKAMELDSTKTELYKDISSAYEKTENYSEAINYFQKYMNSMEAPNTSDYYMFGRSYYQAGTQMGVKGDTIHQKEFMTKADSLFRVVTEQNSDSYLGYFWRSIALASMDPELTQGLAKPLYEQTLEKLLATPNEDGKRNKEILECYMYLGNYHYINKDKAKALEYFKKALEINPNNQDLKDVISKGL